MDIGCHEQAAGQNSFDERSLKSSDDGILQGGGRRRMSWSCAGQTESITFALIFLAFLSGMNLNCKV